MNISLRKANAVQNSIQETLRSINVKTSIDINEFQSVEQELQRANSEVFVNDSRRQKLLLAVYNIRGLVGSANAASGIDLKLTTAAFVDKRVAQLEELAKVLPVTELAVLNGKLDKIKKSPAESRSRLYGVEETVSTTVISAEQIAQVKAEISNLKKQKQKINDEVLELNIKTEVPLSEDVVATLTAEGLI